MKQRGNNQGNLKRNTCEGKTTTKKKMTEGQPGLY